MSRLWRKPLEAFLGPSEVCVRRIGTPEERLPVESASGSFHWQRGIDALDKWLQVHSRPRDRFHVTLANACTRFLTIEWKREFRDENEVIEFARYRYLDTFGETAHDWTITVARGMPGTSMVTAAVDSTLITALESIAKAHKLRLASLQPHLTRAITAHRHELQAHSLWFAVIEPDSLCLAYAQAGEWVHVMTMHTHQDTGRQAFRALTLHGAMAGLNAADSPIYWCGPLASDLNHLDSEGWHVIPLNQGSVQ